MSDAEDIFFKAFRGKTKGTMNPEVRRRIKRALLALVKAELLEPDKEKFKPEYYCDLPGRGY